MWYAVIYLWIVNGLTVLLFGWDKICAKRRWARIPEHSLLWLSAIGGTPGAYLARILFRHKTRKQPFSRWLLSIALFQITAGILLAGKYL